MDSKRDKPDPLTQEKQKPDSDETNPKKKWYERIPVHPFDEDDDNLK